MNECRSAFNCGSIFKQRSITATTTSNFSQSHHQRSPFTSSGVNLSLEIEECCSGFRNRLTFNSSRNVASLRKSSAHHFKASASPFSNASSSSLSLLLQHSRATPIMTIGHFGHSRHSNSSHHQNQHHHPHYGSHDAYHDDAQMLPRIDFPSGQFDRLLRGSSPNNNNNNNSHSRHYSSHHHYTSPGNLPGSDHNTNGSGSWKSRPYESRKK